MPGRIRVLTEAPPTGASWSLQEGVLARGQIHPADEAPQPHFRDSGQPRTHSCPLPASALCFAQPPALGAHLYVG